MEDFERKQSILTFGNNHFRRSDENKQAYITYKKLKPPIAVVPRNGEVVQDITLDHVIYWKTELALSIVMKQIHTILHELHLKVKYFVQARIPTV